MDYSGLTKLLGEFQNLAFFKQLIQILWSRRLTRLWLNPFTGAIFWADLFLVCYALPPQSPSRPSFTYAPLPLSHSFCSVFNCIVFSAKFRFFAFLAHNSPSVFPCRIKPELFMLFRNFSGFGRKLEHFWIHCVWCKFFCC